MRLQELKFNVCFDGEIYSKMSKSKQVLIISTVAVVGLAVVALAIYFVRRNQAGNYIDFNQEMARVGNDNL